MWSNYQGTGRLADHDWKVKGSLREYASISINDEMLKSTIWWKFYRLATFVRLCRVHEVAVARQLGNDETLCVSWNAQFEVMRQILEAQMSVWAKLCAELKLPPTNEHSVYKHDFYECREHHYLMTVYRRHLGMEGVPKLIYGKIFKAFEWLENLYGSPCMILRYQGILHRAFREWEVVGLLRRWISFDKSTNMT